MGGTIREFPLASLLALSRWGRGWCSPAVPHAGLTVSWLCWQEQWRDTRRWQLAVAKELPELEEQPQDASRGPPRFGGFKKNGRFGGWKQGRPPGRALQ